MPSLGEGDDMSTERASEVENMTTFKNAVVIGVEINKFDFINKIDMNEISNNDPYVFNLTSTYQ